MRSFLLMLSVLWSVCANSQHLPVPLNIHQTYVKQTRDSSGLPGKNYWQNSAGYNLKVTFDPSTRLLTGQAEIEYYNNSPDTLKQVVFHLNPNIYKKGVARNMPLKAEDVSDGLMVDSAFVSGKKLNEKYFNNAGTLAVVPVSPIAPHSKINFNIYYHYTLNKTSHLRTGMVDSGSHFVAYFFPRIAVYDDIDGWNRFAYNGQQEFYNDFCHFKAQITVPADYIVWATGDLKNAGEVLQPTIVTRMKKAETEDGVTDVITTEDHLRKLITQPGYLLHSWKFEADNVTDFVFALSNHYIWKSSSLVVDSATMRRSRVDAVFDKAQKDFFEVVNYGRKTLEGMSFYFPKWPYPYPHFTVFQGLDQMEYPMMANDNPLENREETIELTVHEMFHTLFPFYMGTNETKYAWMDEGWATIGEWLLTPYIDSSITNLYGVAGYQNIAGKEADVPVTTLSTLTNGAATFVNNYPKPAMGYLYVKDLLGHSIFFVALHHYMNTWKGKHPMPYDFFNCFNTASGKNLNWFWKRWFFDDGVPDLAVTSAKKTKNGYYIHVQLVGEKPLPVDLKILYTDGSTQQLHYSVAVWERGNTELLIPVKTRKKIASAQAGHHYTPDVDKSNNFLQLEKH